MSTLSALLKSIVAHLALSPADRTTIHNQIDKVAFAAVDAGLSGGNPLVAAENVIKGVAVPFIEQALQVTEGKLVEYIEKRLIGVPPHEAMPASLAMVPSAADPSITLDPVEVPAGVDLSNERLAADAQTGDVIKGGIVQAAPGPVIAQNPSPQAQASVAASNDGVPRFDPFTGEPLTDAFKFDPMTGQPL